MLKDNAKGKTPELWDKDKERYEHVVNELKRILCSYPVLRQPNFSEPFLVYSDASDYAIGAVLTQLRDGKRVAIHYASRSLI